MAHDPGFKHGPSAAPLQAGVPRAFAEALVGYALLVTPTRFLGSHAQIVFIILALAWLILWPAWRLHRVAPGPWWLRALSGVLRGVVVGLALGGCGALIAALLWKAGVGFVPHVTEIAVAAPCFLAARLVVLVGAWLRLLVRRRLRWQLMMSHVLLIVLLVSVTTGVGSIVAAQLLLFGLHSNPSEMAASLAKNLQLSNPGGVSPGQAQRLFGSVVNGNAQVGGEPPLARLTVKPFGSFRLLLLRPDGSILAGYHDFQPEKAKTFFAIYGRPSLWTRIGEDAQSGRLTPFHLPSVSRSEPGDAEVGIAPLRNQRGNLQAIVLAQVPVNNVSSQQLIRSTVAVFTASTVAIILATGLPILALSFLFAYVLSRNLTRRLESVSRVATSIAGGDLSRRAPVGTRDEVGKLAEDVNLMAANLKTTMEDLQTASASAMDALHARQELVASISHELRTPLAIIRAHLEGLVSRQPVAAGSSDVPEAELSVSAPTVLALQNETERLSALVDDLFALSRAETGGLQVQCEPVDVGTLVDEVAGLMRPLVRQDSMLTLSVEAQPGLPPAMADADRLRQIVSNLVRNAARHTPEGGIIALSVAAERPWIALSVADTGEGIPPEHLAHVFDRFYRVDEARGRDSGGAGLGLAIVREFVELMGGKVTVESEVGEGSRFTVYLPGIWKE